MEKAVGSTSRPRLVTKDFCLLFLASFIMYATYFLMITTMARFAIVTYECPESLAGFAASVFFLASMLSRLITGRYSSMVSLKTLSLFGLAVMLLANALYLFAIPTLFSLILVRILHGLSFGCASTVIPAIVVSRLPKSYMGTGTGYFALSLTLGTALGPLIGLLITGGFDYNVLFGVCTAAVALALVAVLFVRGGGKEAIKSTTKSTAKNASKSQPKQRFMFSSMIERKTVMISAFMLLICLAYSSYNAYMNTFSIEIGLGFFAPFSFTAYGLSLLVLRPIAGRLMDKRGDNIVLVPAIIAQTIGFVLLAFTQSAPLLIIVGVFMALGFGTLMTSGQAVVTKLVAPTETALAISTFFLFCDGGAGLGPYLLGFIISGVGYFWMYLMAAGVTLVALLYYVLVYGRRAKVLNEESRPTD